MTSAAAASTSTMMSRIRLRRTRFFNRASVCSSFHTASRSAASSANSSARRRGCLVLALMMLLDLCLDLANAQQRLIPAPFEFVGHQTIVRIGQVVLLLGTACAVAGRFEIALQGGHDFIDAA